MPDIRSQEDLEKWLQGRPPEWAQAIAVRCALRVFPLVFTVLDVPDARLGLSIKQGFVLQSFRATFISWFACRSPGNEVIAARAFSSAAATARAAAPVARAAAAARSLPAFLGAAVSASASARASASAVCAATPDDVRAAAAAAAMRAASAALNTASYANVATASAEMIWETIATDCGWVESARSPAALIDQPLWPVDVRGDAKYNANLPPWARKPLDTYAKSSKDTPWKVIVDWYRAIIANMQTAPKSLFGEEVDLAIATRPDEFWTVSEACTADQIITRVNVLQWFEQPENEWEFFLSYSKDDVAAAQRISTVLEENGHSVFSQFNDMTSGKSFVREMNRGLAGMGRLIAVYSPSYFASGPCQAEWEAAYLLDPAGATGKIIPFMVRPCEPTPLARRLVWHSLLGLDPDAERTEILDAIREPAAPKERTVQRSALKQAISPDVMTAPGNAQLDVARNAVYDEAFAEVDLTELPEMLRTQIHTALAALAGHNCPMGLPQALEVYSDELEARGLNCMVGVLRGQMDFIEAELDEPEASNWLTRASLKKTFENIRKAHARLITHYPLDQRRERLIKAIEIDDRKIESDQFNTFQREIADAIEEAFDEELLTDAYRTVSASRRRVARNVLDLKTPAMPVGGDEEYIKREQDRVLRVREAKRRAIVQEVGFADKSLDVLAKATTVADSPTVGRLTTALSRLVDWFW